MTGPHDSRENEDQDAIGRDDEVARLRGEILRLKASRTWRLARALRHLGSLLSLPCLLLSRPLSLKPLHEVEVSSASPTAKKWQFLGIDPQIEVRWYRDWPLPPGHYEFQIDIVDAVADWQEEMDIYVDSGNGYNEGERLPLVLAPTKEGPYRAQFSLHSWAEQLRLDPAEAKGYITFGSARLRWLTRTEFYGRTVLRAVAANRRAGRPLSQLLNSYWRSLRSGGPREVATTLRNQNSETSVDYAGWIARYDTLTEGDLARLRNELAAIDGLPRIAVLMPVYNTPEPLLRDAIDTVLAQVHEDWELCIADDCSTAPHVPRVLNEYAAQDARIRFVCRSENGHISRASNSALELVTADWVALLDHDDLLRPHALAEVAKEIVRHPEVELVYSDEDKLSEAGTRYDPYFKPDFSRELFRSQNYLNHLTVHRTANIRAVGGWRTGLEGGQDYDLNLRICERIGFRNIRHIPKVLYHWRAVLGSTAAAAIEKSYAYEAGFRALEEHVERTGMVARVEPAADTPFYRLRPGVPEPAPLVSLVVPTRDRVDLLRGCIQSVLSQTTYSNYEILIVDNGSVEEQTLAYFSEAEATGKVRVLRYSGPFNYSAINNFAVNVAAGEVVGLVNNDIEVISPDWLEEMVSWATQPDIGCVGAKLYYANDTIQHAGVITGLGGVAGHSHKYFPRNHPGYAFRLKVVQNLSAVTAACLVVRKSVFEQVGGLNEEVLSVAFNDVDLCLRVRQAGYANVWTPFAELYHFESISRGRENNPEKLARFHREMRYMMQTWDLHPDPFYSPNLTQDREDFSLSDRGPTISRDR